MLRRCPDPVPADLEAGLHQLASLWARHKARPRPKLKVTRHWDELIRTWAYKTNIPLLIRTSQRGIARGEVVLHESGRPLILVDNSPAAWLVMRVMAGECPNLSSLRSKLRHDKIPIAFTLDREMKERSQFRCLRSKGTGPNDLGWKICHKEEVRLGGRGSITIRRLGDLQEHFVRFMSPRNIFLVPKRLAGLGELPQMTEAIKARPNGY